VSPLAAVPGEPLVLSGDAFARGFAQAARCPEMVPAVREAVERRLAETAPALARPEIRRFVADQHAFTRRAYPAILAEIRGIAEGFGLSEAALFDYLHCSSAADLAALPGHEDEGCTAFAATADAGAVLAKNRDYRSEHVAIQRVMRHADPAWNGRQILVLGSLGSPGNFSSGINSDGLAVADTASRTTDMGVGLHRYFLLTWLLVHCADVDEALAAIRRTTHAGSGLVVLADAAGAVAAVELGHRRIGFEHLSTGRVGRTNHFVTPGMAPANLRTADGAASRANSARRWSALCRMLDEPDRRLDARGAADLLAHHGPDAFCRHGGADLSATISGAIYQTGARCLYAALGRPCGQSWRRFDLACVQAPAAAP
jgi:predicted choloylglycine hydrolase